MKKIICLALILSLVMVQAFAEDSDIKGMERIEQPGNDYTRWKQITINNTVEIGEEEQDLSSMVAFNVAVIALATVVIAFCEVFDVFCEEAPELDL